MSTLVSAIAISVVVYICSQGFSKPDDATRTLSSAGFTEIEITGWRPFMAGNGDTFSTGFRAKSPSGDIVTGAVTEGLWGKGKTVRFD